MSDLAASLAADPMSVNENVADEICVVREYRLTPLLGVGVAKEAPLPDCDGVVWSSVRHTVAAEYAGTGAPARRGIIAV
jgi:hypothetical protein